ncbi:hypothetical protein J6590_082111 [Homalodisca vitripennis]|nr:hypothetical protein J6590_082111 [Homalodisca vitripennis]
MWGYATLYAEYNMIPVYDGFSTGQSENRLHTVITYHCAVQYKPVTTAVVENANDSHALFYCSPPSSAQDRVPRPCPEEHCHCVGCPGVRPEEDESPGSGYNQEHQSYILIRII